MDAKLRFINDDFRISQEEFDKGWTMPYPHYHFSYEIYILKSGSRIVTAGDEEYLTTIGDAVLFSSNLPHKSRGNGAFSGICIHFSTQYLDLYFTQEAKRRLLYCFKNPVVHLDTHALEQIKSIADNFTGYAENNFIRLSVILGLLNGSVPSDKRPQPNSSDTVNSVIAYVNQGYTSIKTVAEIADRFGITENYVYNIFKSKYNMTPKTYINSLRIEYACRMIKRDTITAKAVGAECGFDSYEHFCRTFKKLTGKTPGQYRRSLK